MSFGSASPSRVGQRVRKKSKRYEDFIGNAPSAPMFDFSPDSPRSPAISSPSLPSSSQNPSTSSPAISSPLIGGEGMRASGFSSWSKTYSKQLLNKMPDASPVELKSRLTDTWNDLPEEERAQWKALATKEAKESQQRLKEARKKAKPSPSKPRASTGKKSSDAKPRPKRKSDKKKGVPATPVKEDIPETRGTGETAKDAAAHLMLLGESMKYIGERLTEHQGPIAVSGSVSVLLDALLSATGPLLCLTREIPIMRGAIPQRTIENILDDTHYFMPGL